MVSVCLPSDALLQHLPSYLGFSYLGCGVSLQGCSSKAQPLLLTLDVRYLLTTATLDLECGLASFGPPGPAKPPLLESQEKPGVTGKFGLGIRNEAEQRLIEFCQEECTGHSKHPLPTTQEKTLHIDITRWSTPKSDWLYSLQPKMEKLYTVSKNKARSWLWLRPWMPYCQVQTEIEQSGGKPLDNSGRQGSRPPPWNRNAKKQNGCLGRPYK